MIGDKPGQRPRSGCGMSGTGYDAGARVLPRMRALSKRCEEMAGVTGLEPAASGVTGQRSNRLSYTPASRVPLEVDKPRAGVKPTTPALAQAFHGPYPRSERSGRSSAVEHGVYTAGVGGSIPSARTTPRPGPAPPTRPGAAVSPNALAGV